MLSTQILSKIWVVGVEIIIVIALLIAVVAFAAFSLGMGSTGLRVRFSGLVVLSLDLFGGEDLIGLVDFLEDLSFSFVDVGVVFFGEFLI